jgi:DNA-binding response OmpR family regulator
MERSGRTVLVVDDDGPSRAVLGIVCGSRGHAVVEAASGADGVAVALERRPDLIVLDVSLPDMSGLEVCSRLREAGVDVSILMLSGHADPVDIATALGAGADAYLTKPYQVRDLVARLEEHLQGAPGSTAVPAVAPPNPDSHPGDHPVTAAPSRADRH